MNSGRKLKERPVYFSVLCFSHLIKATSMEVIKDLNHKTHGDIFSSPINSDALSIPSKALNSRINNSV